jgi:hypothetical protein
VGQVGSDLDKWGVGERRREVEWARERETEKRQGRAYWAAEKGLDSITGADAACRQREGGRHVAAADSS